MTQEENLDTSHQANKPVSDQASDDITDASKNIVEDRGARKSSSSSVQIQIESNNSADRKSSLDAKVPVRDRDRGDHSLSLNVGNKSDHTIDDRNNSVEMTVITQQNSNDSLRDIQSNIIENINNKDNVNNNVINISDRAPADNISFHSEKPINTDLQSGGGATGGKFPKNENTLNAITDEKNDGNDSVKCLKENNNNNNNNRQSVDEQVPKQIGDSDKAKEIKNEDPIARLNALRANISNALKEVKAVLDQHAPPPPDAVDENDEKRDGQDDDCVKFRFVRRIRKKSVIKLEDEEIVCIAPSDSQEENATALPETTIARDGDPDKQQKTANLVKADLLSATPDKIEGPMDKIVDPASNKTGNDNENKTSEDRLKKPKDTTREPTDNRSLDIQKEGDQKETATPKDDGTKPKDVKMRRKSTLQKATSIDGEKPKTKEATRLKRASLNETKGSVIKATKLKRASICEGDLAKIPRPATEKKLVKTPSKNGETVKVKGSVKSTPSKDITVEPSSNSAKKEPEQSTTKIKTIVESKDIKPQPKEVQKATITKSMISQPTKPNDAKIEAPSQNSSNQVTRIMSSTDKSGPSESVALNNEKPTVAVTNAVKSDTTRNTAQVHPLAPSGNDKIVPSTTQSIKADPLQSDVGVVPIVKSSMVSSSTSAQGSQTVSKTVSKADVVESIVPQGKTPEKSAISSMELIPLKELTPTKDMKVPQSPAVMDISEKIALQELEPGQSTKLQRPRLVRMNAEERNQQKILSNVEKDQQKTKVEPLAKAVIKESTQQSSVKIEKNENQIPRVSPTRKIQPPAVTPVASPNKQEEKKIEVETIQSGKGESAKVASIVETKAKQEETKIKPTKIPSLIAPSPISTPTSSPAKQEEKTPQSSTPIASPSKPEEEVPTLSTTTEEKTKPDPKSIPTLPPSEEEKSLILTMKPPQIPTSITPDTPQPPLKLDIELATTVPPQTEAATPESSSSVPDTPTSDDAKPKKRKTKRKVIIKRIKRKLSRDNSLEEKVEPEICEKPIELPIEDPEPEPEPEEIVPPKPKSCLKIRSYDPGDIVMYADRVRKIVKWKKATVIEKITSISYKLDIEGEEKPAHISYIKKYTDKKVQFGGKEYLEIDYEQEYEEPEVYNIWARV